MQGLIGQETTLELRRHFISFSLSRHLAAALTPECTSETDKFSLKTPGSQGQAALLFKAKSAITCPH